MSKELKGKTGLSKLEVGSILVSYYLSEWLEPKKVVRLFIEAWLLRLLFSDH
jgi:hypothetical protein